MLISVIIPVYNREFELKRAMNSVLTQTIQDFEILVIDDFSETDLKKVCEGLNDERIKYFKLDKKGNGNVCRNYGIKKAGGKYIAMLDSDDEWLSSHLELKLKRILELNVDGVFGSAIVDNSNTRTPVLSRPFNQGEKMVNYLLSSGSAPTPTHFYKAECAKSILWNEKLLRHQDYDFSVRFANQFSFMPSLDLTCIVYWEKGTVRDKSLESQLSFMEANKATIEPDLYNHYFKNLYFQIYKTENISLQLKEKIKSLATHYIKFCSLNDYISVHGINKSTFYKILVRVKFVLKVLAA